MAESRWDETWHRLREWTSGQAPSERLAAQLLLNDGYKDLDPSHPLGGRDGGKDAVCTKDGLGWAMAVYFPRGQQSFEDIKKKFAADLGGARKNSITGFAFVTNQELRLAERRELVESAPDLKIELYHLERITAALDSAPLAATRKQFLNIDFNVNPIDEIQQLRDEMLENQKRLEGLQTGGDTFCYFMLYWFDLDASIAKQICVIRRGKYPLYDLRFRVWDYDARTDAYNQSIGEFNSAAAMLPGKWVLQPFHYYRINFFARNGNWRQDLILRRSDKHRCWLAATKVFAQNGRDVLFEDGLEQFETEFGPVEWRG